MTDYIEREAAIAAIKKDNIGGLNYESILKRIPSADVQPVKHGKWSQIKILQDAYKAKECSACKLTFWDLYHWNYCPNCGAKMDGET